MRAVIYMIMFLIAFYLIQDIKTIIGVILIVLAGNIKTRTQVEYELEEMSKRIK